MSASNSSTASDGISRDRPSDPRRWGFARASLVLGMLALVSVPVFKTLTHLPPFMGMLGALGVMWVFTEILHRDKDESERQAFSVAAALRKITWIALAAYVAGVLAFIVQSALLA